MSGTSVTVAPGRTPTQVSGAPLAAGTSLFNSDPNNAIWLADNNGVAPSNGMQLNSLATGTWTKASLCYACVDTGVTTPITMQISGDLSNVTDPVAIATATAIALLASGVTINAATDLLISAPIPQGHLSALLDVRKYSSLLINYSASTSPAEINVHQWADIAKTVLITTDTITNGPIGSLIPTAIVPIKGSYVEIISILGDLTLLFVEGSTRILPLSFDFNNGYGTAFQDTILPVANTAYQLTQVPQSSYLSGDVWINIQIGSTAVKGGFYFEYYHDNVVRQVFFADTSEPDVSIFNANTFIRKKIALPKLATVTLHFFCSTGSGGANVGIVVDMFET